MKWFNGKKSMKDAALPFTFAKKSFWQVFMKYEFEVTWVKKQPYCREDETAIKSNMRKQNKITENLLILGYDTANDKSLQNKRTFTCCDGEVRITIFWFSFVLAKLKFFLNRAELCKLHPLTKI